MADFFLQIVKFDFNGNFYADFDLMLVWPQPTRLNEREIFEPWDEFQKLRKFQKLKNTVNSTHPNTNSLHTHKWDLRLDSSIWACLDLDFREETNSWIIFVQSNFREDFTDLSTRWTHQVEDFRHWRFSKEFHCLTANSRPRMSRFFPPHQLMFFLLILRGSGHRPHNYRIGVFNQKFNYFFS